MNSAPKAYSYIRFSTPEQAKGDSYRRQRDAAEKYCALNGYQLIGTKDYLFFDRGRSAFKGKNFDDTGELARFLSYVQNGTIAPGSLLIIESLDRLSREHVRHALPRFLDILKGGIRIYTSSDAKLYTEDYNDVDLILSILQMSRAHNESSLKGERISKAWQQKQKEARENKVPLGKACPYWLKLENGAYQEITERVQIVREIFRLATSGYGHRTIAKMLNAENVPIFGSDNRNKTGLWGSSSTAKILSNRALLGEYQPTGLVDGKRMKLGEPIPGFFPVVIQESQFYDAQAARSMRNVSKTTKGTLNFNIWQGVAKCALCLESMHLVNKGQPPKGGKYLRCYGHAKGRCSNKLFSTAQADLVFMEILAKVDSLSLVQDSQAKIQKEISRIDLRLLSIQKRQGEIESQMLALDESLPPSVLQTISKLDQEAKTLKTNKARLKADAQREKIVNKQDFFNRLDLLTYEGRFKANYLLKALNVEIKFERRLDKLFYAIEVEGELNFVIKQDRERLEYYPYTDELGELLKVHGDDGAFQALHFSMVNNVFDLLERMKENERIETVLAHRSIPRQL